MSTLSSEIELLAAGSRLSVLAKHIVDGFLIGMHKGTRRGIGTEFSQYRSYQPGDDIRQIDWKMYARSDRYYIKESDVETSVTLRFFLDASASMLYEENGYSRFQYASLLTAVLGTFAHRQGDAFALHIVNNLDQQFLRESRNKHQLSRFYQMIESAECKGKWPVSEGWLTDNVSSLKREFWVVCSDMLDGAEKWKSFVRLAETIGNEVHFFQVLGANELSLPTEKVMTFKDPEADRERNIRTSAVRDQYQKNLGSYLEELKSNVISRRTRLDLISMETPLSDALRQILQRRLSS